MRFFHKCVGATVVALAVLALAPAETHAATLDTVKQRGSLVCGVSNGIAGFSIKDDKGAWSGLDVDFCRAVAAAVFADPGKVDFVPLQADERFAALKSGKIVNRDDLSITPPDEPPFKNQDVARHNNWRSGLFLPLRTPAGIPLGTLHLRLMLAMQPVMKLLAPSLRRMIDRGPQGRTRILVAQRCIVEAVRTRKPEEAEAWMTRHVQDFRRGYELAGIALDTKVGTASIAD